MRIGRRERDIPVSIAIVVPVWKAEARSSGRDHNDDRGEVIILALVDLTRKLVLV